MSLMKANTESIYYFRNRKQKILLYSKIYVLLDSSFSFGLKGLKCDVNPHAFKISMICDSKIGVLI